MHLRRSSLSTTSLVCLVSIIFGCGLIVTHRPGSAQDIKSTSQASQATPQNQQERVLQGAIVRAGSVVGASLTGPGGQRLGKVTDFVLDAYDGRLAVAVVDNGKESAGQTTLVPVGVLGDLSSANDHVLKLHATVVPAFSTEISPQSLDRKQVAELYKHFGLKPYWSEESEGSAHDWFSPLSKLIGKSVKNAGGTTLGQIKDFAVTADGRVAYVGLSQDEKSDRLYPVPLSAFSIGDGKDQWILDLPKDILEHTPTFAVNNWPTTLDRGWIEYVSVRYGRPILGGVERHR